MGGRIRFLEIHQRTKGSCTVTRPCISREGKCEDMEDYQYFNNRVFNFNPTTNLPIHYHQELWNHEHFLYASNQDILNPPEAFGQQPSSYIPSPRFQHKSTLEDLLAEFISESRASCAKSEEKTKSTLDDALADFISESRGRFTENDARVDMIEARLDSIETYISEISSTIKCLEAMIGDLAYVVKGKAKITFTSDTEASPRECKAIHLRSGMQLSETGREPQEVAELEKEQPVKVVPGSITFSDDPPLVAPKLPFPQKSQQKEIDEEVAKFLEVYNRVVLLDHEDEGLHEGLVTEDEDSEAAKSAENGEFEGNTMKVDQTTVKHKEVEEKCHKLHHINSPPR